MLYLFLLLLMITHVSESIDKLNVEIGEGIIGVEEFILTTHIYQHTRLLQFDLFIYCNGGVNLLSQY